MKTPRHTGFTHPGRLERHGTMKALVTAGVLVGVSACGAPMTWRTDTLADLYQTQQFGYAASGGGIPLQIIGAPFPGTDAQALAEAVEAAMYGRNPGQPVAFVSDGRAEPPADYRVVLRFAPTQRRRAPLCSEAVRKGEAEAPEPQDGGFTVQAAYCLGTITLSGVAGSRSGVSGIEDPGFATLIAQLTRHLLPRIQRTDKECDGLWPHC